MTRLEREVLRTVPRPGRAALVVRLVPPRGEAPARIEFREARTRKWFALPLEAVFIHAVKRDVEATIAERRRRLHGQRPRGSLLTPALGARP